MTSEIKSGLSSLVGASVARNNDGAIVQVPKDRIRQAQRSESEAVQTTFNTAVSSSVAAVNEATESVQAISSLNSREVAEREVSEALREASNASVENVEQASDLARDLARRITNEPDLGLSASKKTPLEQLAQKISNIFSS